jgi:hypothetical protein
VPSREGVDDGQCAQQCQKLPDRAIGVTEIARCETNPTDLRPLTDAQLAVARWIVAGYGSVAIARQLSLNHHTIARWKRDPRMIEAVRLLRARADAAVVEMIAKKRVAAAGGSPRSDAS